SGVLSSDLEAGWGKTDYSIDIYFKAIREGHYSSYIAKDTFMGMMYMEDAIGAIIQLMEADGVKLINGNAYNLSAMSIEPEMMKEAIRENYPEIQLDYEVDPIRQNIADSWPNNIDISCARAEWGFNPKYDLNKMTEVMLNEIAKKDKVR